MIRRIKKIFKVIIIAIISFIAIILVAHFIGRIINNRTPEGGINESMYADINGDMDYQTNYQLACEYFDDVNAPYKEMFVMKDATHGLLESRSEEFSEIVHKIAGK